jgi:hypothetical protein
LKLISFLCEHSFRFDLPSWLQAVFFLSGQ